MDDNSLALGRHYAKQPIMNHKEVVNALARRTGVHVDDVDKILCQLPILLKDSYNNLVGVRLTGLGTFRGRLVPMKTGTFQGNTNRTRTILETIAKDRIVPDLILDRSFVNECKEGLYFLDLETFHSLAQDKLRKFLQTRNYDYYSQQKTRQAIQDAFKEDVPEDAQRRLHVELAFGKMEKSTAV